MSKSSRMPQPSDEMIVRISSWPSILTRLAFSTFSSLPRSARIAWTFESRPCLAEPPAESPSTRNSSVSSLLLLRQSASLPGRLELSRLFLRRGQLAGLAGRLAGLGGHHALFEDRLGVLGVFLEVARQLLVDRRRDEPLDLAVAQLALGLALELGLGDLDADDRDQALADVVAGR